MVSIAPNEFRITGRVLSKKKNASLENFCTVTIHLEKVEHLHGPGDFLSSSEKEVEVNISDTLAAGLKEGEHIQCKIRKAPGHFFVLPDSIRSTGMKS